MNFKDRIKKTPFGKVIKRYLENYRENKKTKQHKAEIRKLLEDASRSDKHIYYCGVCESSNMGDMAQTYCTLNWFEKNYPEYVVLKCRTSVFRDEKVDLISAMRKVMQKNDIVFFQSGYNTHDLGDGREDLMHQKVIQAFPNIEMIMLPQTVFFESEERKQLCSNVYNAHKKLLFFSRDPVSLRISEEMFPNLTIKLYPDIVTSLIGYYQGSENRTGIFLCRRKDVEQFYSEDEYLEIANELRQIDNEVTIADTIISASNNDIYNQLKEYVEDMIKTFGCFRIVVTDKYHGLIFSLISNTPVIVLKTKDHKVTSGYEWFSKVYPDRVFYAEKPKDITFLCEKILKNPQYYKLDNYFDREYYHRLKDEIDNWRTCLGEDIGSN